MISNETLQQFLLRYGKDYSRVLGTGATRKAYYCKKYNRVFKYSIMGWDMHDHQAVTEYQKAKSLPNNYKKFIPVEQYAIVKYEKRDVEVTVMMLCKPFDSDERFINSWRREYRNYCDIYEYAANYYHLGLKMASEFRQFLSDYQIGDLSNGNLGICEDHFVVVDAGFSRS